MNRFVVMWDMYGLEYIAPIDEPLKKRSWALLKGEPANNFNLPNLEILSIRARVNSQRNYEIYVIDVEEDVSANDLIKMFKANPQSSVNLIRERGHCYFGEPLSTARKPVIT